MMETILVIAFLGSLILNGVFVLLFREKIEELNTKLTQNYLDLEIARSQKKSLEVKTGQFVEKWIPIQKEFTFNAQKAKFVGDPIDYIIFDDNGIIFLEVKTNKSQLNKNQKNVRDLVEEGKVYFKELRIKTLEDEEKDD